MHDPVSPRSFRMNPGHYSLAGPTPRGSPLLISLFFLFFIFLKKNQMKNK